MRSGLRPVAISCNNGTYCSPFAALVDARAPSESASEASNALKKADSMQENEFRGEAVRKVVLRGYFATLARMRKRCPTDLSDAEGKYIEPHAPAPKGCGRPRTHTLREISRTPSSTSLRAAASGAYSPTTSL
jgi:hypothetical protein